MKFTTPEPLSQYFVYEHHDTGVIECTTIMPPAGQHTTRWNDMDALVRFLEWNDQLNDQASFRAMARG